MSISPPQQPLTPVPPSPPKTPPHRILEDPASETSPPQAIGSSDFGSGSGSGSDPAQHNASSGWTFPTSGDLAYLASLPRPTIQFRTQTQSSESMTSDSNSTKNMDATTDADADADAETGEAIPTTDSDFLLAISRHRTATREAREFRRRDTWAIGNRWARHVKVIDVGAVEPEGGGRKKSC